MISPRALARRTISVELLPPLRNLLGPSVGRPRAANDDRRRQTTTAFPLVRGGALGTTAGVHARSYVEEVQRFPGTRRPLVRTRRRRQPCLDGLKRTAISSVLVHSRTRETSSRALGWKPSSRTYDVGPLARCRASCPGTRTVARRDQLVGPAVGRMELHRPRGDQSPYSRARRIFLRADTGLRLSERPVFAFRASPLSLSV